MEIEQHLGMSLQQYSLNEQEWDLPHRSPIGTFGSTFSASIALECFYIVGNIVYLLVDLICYLLSSKQIREIPINTLSIYVHHLSFQRWLPLVQSRHTFGKRGQIDALP